MQSNQTMLQCIPNHPLSLFLILKHPVGEESQSFGETVCFHKLLLLLEKQLISVPPILCTKKLRWIWLVSFFLSPTHWEKIGIRIQQRMDVAGSPAEEYT